MQTAPIRRTSQSAFTLIELLVVVAIIALLLSILLPSLQCAREQAKTVKCAANLRSIGQAVHICEAENNGFGPTWDDGHWFDVTGSQPRTMFTWVDLLFDAGYLGDFHVHRCPSDDNRTSPDSPMVVRGSPGKWGFVWVDEFDRDEGLKPGTRTSYAQNLYMHTNWPEDKFEDATRQVYAADSWWSWFGSLNALWLFAPEFLRGRVPPVNDWIHIEANFTGWRHGCGNDPPSANLLLRDGHVDRVTPRRPRSREEFTQARRPGEQSVTVDTNKYFMWLPGEQEARSSQDPYRGQIAAWREATPPLLPAAFHKQGKTIFGGETMPPAFPEELSCNWRTQHRAWKKLPDLPRDRD